MSKESIPVSAGAQQFEEFKAGLRIYEANELVVLLEEELSVRADRLIEAYSRPDVGFEERRKAMMDYGVAAMAQHGLVTEGQPAHNPYEPLPAMDFARSRLEAYAEGDPLQSSILERTVFFSNDPRARRRLGEMISASVTPWGDYDNLTFAAGIVTKKVFAELL